MESNNNNQKEPITYSDAEIKAMNKQYQWDKKAPQREIAKEKRRLYNKEYYQRPEVKAREKAKYDRYYAEGRYKKYSKTYQRKHREKINVYNRKYEREHPRSPEQKARKKLYDQERRKRLVVEKNKANGK